MDVFALVDDLWEGRTTTLDSHPFRTFGDLTEVQQGVAFLPTFANVSAFTTGEGLVLVDTGSQFTARQVHEQVRGWTGEALRTAVYSHGHIDHVFGVPVFEEEATTNGWPAPEVVAHEHLPRRFDRYILTAGYNGVINQRQFQIPGLSWPTEYRYPDTTYRDHHRLEVGGLELELHHAMGETDDHTWTWVPEHRVLCCGDMFIWASPNAGNPQKVQRYPREWAMALREMVALEPEVLLPGHGFPIRGADRVRQALTDCAELLESLVDQTLSLMNEGARLDEVLHSVRAPQALLDKPYLQPVYDEPEFIVHNIWRLYGGWYDGNPAHLKPAPDAEVAAEVAALAGGAARVAARAEEVAARGDLRLAGHLAELAVQADPDDPALHRVRAAVFGARAAEEQSLMAQGVFSWAERESQDRAGTGGT